MSLVVEEVVTGSGTTVVSLTSWTPQPDELILLFVATRTYNLNLATPTGNGLTFVEVANIPNDDDENSVRLYRALCNSAVTGQITVSGDLPTNVIVAAAVRISGADLSGSNGSGAIESLASDDGPVGSNDDMLVVCNALTYGAFVIAGGTHRNTTFSLPGGETSVSINNSSGSGTNTTSLSVWYEAATNPAAVTVGASNDLSGATDWAIVAVSVKPASLLSSTIVRRQRVHRMYSARRCTFRSPSGDVIMTATVWEEPISSNYSGNEVEGVEVKNSVRLIGNFDPRGKIVQGDYVYLTPEVFFVITSVKTFGAFRTEFLAVREVSQRASVANFLLPLNLSAATAETALWQPALGKRFRLMDLELRISGTTQTLLTFRDGTAGRICLYGAPSGASDLFNPSLPIGGILSDAVDNVLTVERSVSVTLQGFLAGIEE